MTATARRAKLRYEVSARGRATRARYTRSAEPLASKAQYRSTSWGMWARMRWYIQDRVNGSEARCAAFGFAREQALNGSAVESVIAEAAALALRHADEVAP